MNDSFEQLEKLQLEMEYNFNTEEQLQKIRQLWDTLQTTTWTDLNEIINEYNYLNGKILSLMSDVTNNSELLLVESKETYNLVYNATIELPQLMEQFSMLQSIGINVLNDSEINDDHLKQLNEIYYPMQTSIIDMLNRMTIIFSDKHFITELQEPLDLLENSTAKYLNEVAVIGREKVTLSEFNEVATKSIDDNYRFYLASIDVMKSKLQKEYNQINESMIINIILLLIVFFVALLIFVSLYLAIKQSVRSLEEGTKQIADGNLNVELSLNTKDEMHNVEIAFNQMTKQLNELVREISMSAEHVAASSEQLNASAQEATASVDQITTAVNEISSETELQAESLNESAQAMNEMVTGIERIAENSVRISSLTNESTLYADKGNKTAEKTLHQMEMINETVEKTSGKINELHEHSSKIDSIINVISEIADQTNLLALNATIEAARAGEHGKGFAVVADEVRKLAEKSRQSTAQIADLIQTVQKDTTNSVEMMEHVIKDVRLGIEMTKETAYQFNHILESMQTLNPQMEEISATTTQFSAQVEQVATSIKNLLKMVQQTSDQTVEISSSSEEQLAIMEEVSTSANSLSEMAESLQNLVAQFKLQ